MKYYYNLYKDKENTPKEDKYLIVLSQNEKNHLEIFHSILLIQEVMPKKDLFVVGVASGFEEALELVEKITQQVYDETGGTDIRNYILRRQQEYEEGNV